MIISLFFYFKVYEDWTAGSLHTFQEQINNYFSNPNSSHKYKTIENGSIVEHKQLYGFNAGKKFKFAKLVFKNTNDLNKVKNCIMTIVDYLMILNMKYMSQIFRLY